MQNNLLVHKHLIIRAESLKAPTNEERLKDWFEEFIRSINMKLFMGPYVKYCKMPGNRGITAVAIICDKIKEDFDIQKIEYKFLNRETGLQDINDNNNQKNNLSHLS